MDTTQYILAGNLISGSGDSIQRKVALAINGARISKIQSANKIHNIAREKIIDFSHCTLLPPLFDCSITLSSSPSIDLKLRESINRLETQPNFELFNKHLSYCFDHGVLGVANNSTPPIFTRQDLKKIMVEQSVILKSSASPQKNENNAAGSEGDFLRIVYSSGPGDENRRLMRRDELNHLIQNHAHLHTVVVANGQQHVQEALDAGCSGIEQGYQMGRENLREIANRGVLWIPNVLLSKTALDGSASGGDVCCRFSQRYVAPGKKIPGAEQFWKKIFTEQLSLLRYAKESGVKTAVGSGAGNVAILHGESVVEEMKLFIKAGYTLEETIHCASVRGASFFTKGELGAIKAGGPATFLLTRGTPQQLPRKLAFLEGMFINGSPAV